MGVPLSLVGTVEVKLDIDPADFAGMSAPTVTSEIQRVAKEIAPGVDFYAGDIQVAAEWVVDASGR